MREQATQAANAWAELIQAEAATFPAGVEEVQYRPDYGVTVLYDGFRYFADLEGNTVSNPSQAYDLGIYPDAPISDIKLLPGVSVDFTWETGELDSEGWPVTDGDSISLLDPALEAAFLNSVMDWVALVQSTSLPENTDGVDYSRDSGKTVLRNADYQYFGNLEGTELVDTRDEAYDLGIYPSMPETSSISYSVSRRDLQAIYDDGALSFRVPLQDL